MEKMDLEHIMEIGRELGLDGEKLLDFIKEREKVNAERERLYEEREERNNRRAHEKLMKEYEIKQKELDQEQRNENVNEAIAPAPPPAMQHIPPKLPKLPPFNDGRDELDAYLKRFERFAVAMQRREEDWATSLSALLTGRALDAFARMPSASARDYKEVKKTLLNRYLLSEEGFRIKFRSARLEYAETYTQFIDRISGYLTRWIELGGVNKTYEGICEMIVKEQTLKVCSKALFLKERGSGSLAQMAALADHYAEAHNDRYFAERKPRRDNSKPTVNNSPSPKPNSSGAPRLSRERLSQLEVEGRCYECGRQGHIARDCRSKPNSSQSFTKRGANLIVGSQRDSSGFGAKETGMACLPAKSGMCDCGDIVGKDVTLKCGHRLPIVSAACTASNTMPVTKGYIGKDLVSVMRDTGCSTVVVRRGLVDNSQMLGIDEGCILMDGTVRKYPVAQVQLKTPYFSGTVLNTLCMDNPVYDVVIGNIEGARPPHEPVPAWGAGQDNLHSDDIDHVVNEGGEVISPDGDLSEREHSKPIQSDVNPPVVNPIVKLNEAQSVETRGQKKKREAGIKELKVLDVSMCDAASSREEMLKAQREDETLEKLWKLAENEEVRLTSKESEVRYKIKDGLLYREFSSPKVDHWHTYKQLVVPRKFRNYVIRVAHDSPMAGHMGSKRTTAL
ncbi:uncharacterized protein LOC117100464 [Anneissia japonica]|uniref:uncharacterized protein LOC117100464 n=1 Tax=Anneissia japonica TaxID=1529436 RepID=UPI0014255619|nr:uncharacterized protein LOC117100464 [Anneissia japonica]